VLVEAECLAPGADTSISGKRVARELADLVALRPLDIYEAVGRRLAAGGTA